MNQVLIVQNQERVNREWMSDQATSRPRYQNAGVLNTEIINSEWEAMSEDPKNISFDDVAYRSYWRLQAVDGWTPFLLDYNQRGNPRSFFLLLMLTIDAQIIQTYKATLLKNGND